MTRSEQILSDFIKKNRPKWEALGFDFYSGDCHHLASALHTVLGAGRLLAGCLDNDIPDYHHMVYQAEDGWTWDISGKHAIENWEETFGIGDFVWIDITDENLVDWLTANNATYNDDVAFVLESDLRSLLSDQTFDSSLSL